MPRFGPISRTRLATAHPDLQRLFNTVVSQFDCMVLEGERTEEQQRENVRKGTSKTMDSRHLDRPSNAVDVVPYPVDWEDTQRFIFFAGFVLGVASQLGLCIRWGGDWNRNLRLNDNTFNDLVHFELCKPETP